MFHVLAVDFGDFGDVGTFGKILSTITKPRTKFLVLLGIETVKSLKIALQFLLSFENTLATKEYRE